MAPTIQEEHKQISDASVGLSHILKPFTWTRLVRMDVGHVGMLKKGVKSILGKRNNLDMVVDKEVEVDNNNVKKGKVCEDLSMTEVAAVLQHPCRE